MISENSKTFVLNLLDNLNLTRSGKYIFLSNLSTALYSHGNTTKKKIKKSIADSEYWKFKTNKTPNNRITIHDEIVAS